MKKQHLSAVGLAGTLGLIAQTTLAQGWYTIDDFQYLPGTNAFANSLAKDSTGSIIYSAGYGQDASPANHALAFKSTSGGTNWALMDDYVNTANPVYRGIAADSAGNIYAAGFDYDGSVETWFTRRSTDGGGTWSTVDLLSLGTPVARPLALATDEAGNVYAAGEVQTNAVLGNDLWLVRKGTSVNPWATVDLFGTPMKLVRWTPKGVFCHPTAGIFVVGQAAGQPITSKSGTTFPELWTVRRSQDGGASWTTVDTYYLGGSPLNASWASGVGADSAGNLYVVGTASLPSGKAYYWSWIVRMSSDGGNSWTTVDQFPPSSPSSHPSALAAAFGSDPGGNLFVAGYDNQGPSGFGSASSQRWIVREGHGGANSWQTVDTFQYVAGRASQPAAVVGDNSGHIYVAGHGADAAGVNHWLVRKN
jgi:hypothetical protein